MVSYFEDVVVAKDPGEAAVSYFEDVLVLVAFFVDGDLVGC